MKKLIFLISLFTIIYYCGCGIDANEKLYRRQITVESNLSEFRIGNTYFDSTTVYPYILDDFTNNGPTLYNLKLTIYPIQNTGLLKFKILGGEGNYPLPASSLNLKDTLTIATPIDSTSIFIQGFEFN